MERQNFSVENEEQDQELIPSNNAQKKDGINKDFNIVKMERISKLQNILNKNAKLRESEGQKKERIKYKLFDLDKPVQKRSLPMLKSTYKVPQQTNMQQLQKNNLSSEESIYESSLLAKYRQEVVFNNQHIRTLLKYEPNSKTLDENPEAQQKQGDKNFLKLKVKNMQLQQPKNQQNHLKSSKLKSSISKHSIERIDSIERLTLDKSKVSPQKQKTKEFRRKKRNASFLNLTKIQHLPQIIFPKNSKCTRSKFPSLSMAQIDTNLLTNEILEMEELRMIEVRNREKKQRLLKQKIKAHNRTQFLYSLNQ